jgi:hypothetical protein
MRQKVYRELEELERIDAAAVKARDCRSRPSCVAVFRELLSTHTRRVRRRLPAERNEDLAAQFEME